MDNTFSIMRRLVVFTVVFSAVYCEEETVFKVAGADSYLEAYKVTHSDSVNELLDNAIKKSDREFVEPGGYPYPNSQSQYGPPFGSSGPSAPNYNYGPPPRPQYSPPNPGAVYGPPNPGPAYGPPNTGPAYGPPNPGPAYGPPNPAPVYGPPSPAYSQSGPAPVYGAPSSVQVFYGMPHAMLSIWDKLKLKLDLFTIGKILIKLVIFKKIVSLIAILCLLLFIPSLKHKEESSSEGDEEMMRQLNINISGEQSLNNVSAYVIEAIENFSMDKKSPRCNSMFCKTQNVLKNIEKKLSYKKLAKLYSKELKS